jgi:hypothetical protein
VLGNILGHESEIKKSHRKVARSSKKWFPVRDTYGVEVAPDQEDVVILAVTVELDNMAHARKSTVFFINEATRCREHRDDAFTLRIGHSEPKDKSC